MDECQQQKHTQHAPTTKTECDYFNGWIKKCHICENLTKGGEPPSDIAGKAEEEDELVCKEALEVLTDW